MKIYKENAMRKISLIIMGLCLGVILTLALLWRGLARKAQAQSGDATPQGASLNSDEGSLQPALQFASGDETMPAAFSAGPKAPSALPTPIPGENLVYFVPTDNDTTATVLYLYNTDPVTHTVALRGFNYDGAMVYAQNITVKATSFLRLISDSVAAERELKDKNHRKLIKLHGKVACQLVQGNSHIDSEYPTGAHGHIGQHS
jgi:hypothetical protein